MFSVTSSATSGPCWQEINSLVANNPENNFSKIIEQLSKNRDSLCREDLPNLKQLYDILLNHNADEKTIQAIKLIAKRLLVNFPFKRLPDELQVKLATYCDYQTLRNVSQASISSVDVIHDPQVLISLIEKDELRVSTTEFLELLQSCRGLKLKNLSLVTIISDRENINDDFIEKLFKKIAAVESLDLAGCNQITDDGLKFLVPLLKSLRSLGLSYCLEITDNGLKDLAPYLKSLQALDLSYCINITNVGITALAPHLASLQSLKLRMCHKITEAGWIALAPCLNALQVLDLEDCAQITDNDLTILTSHCTSLLGLTLRSCDKITDNSLKALAIRPLSLQVLDLSHCSQITDDGIRTLAPKLSSLRNLDLSFCALITDDSLTTLASHLKGSLQFLNLMSCPQVTDLGIEALAPHLGNVKHLYLIRCSITDKGLKTLSSYLKGFLLTLNLMNCRNITDIAMNDLAPHLRSLTSLNLSGCSAITDIGLITLAPYLTSLTTLDVSKTQITQESNAAVKKFAPEASILIES